MVGVEIRAMGARAMVLARQGQIGPGLLLALSLAALVVLGLDTDLWRPVEQIALIASALSGIRCLACDAPWTPKFHRASVNGALAGPGLNEPRPLVQVS